MTTTIPAIAMPQPSFAASYDDPELEGPPQSFMLYGGKGVQKTLAVGQLVKEGFFNKAFFLNLDNSTEVWATDPAIRAARKDGRLNVKTIDSRDPGARMQIEGIILELAGYWRTPTGHIIPNPNLPDFGYDLFAIDTVNLMHEVALNDYLLTTYNDKGTALDGRAAYGKVAIWMDQMIRLIHDSPRFTGGFLMHAKTVEEKTGGVKVKPKLSGSFQDSIATIPSIVAFLQYEKHPETKESVLTATLGESDLYESGNRYNLPPKIYGFNLASPRSTPPSPTTAITPPQ
jgi:hypothetical protein